MKNSMLFSSYKENGWAVKWAGAKQAYAVLDTKQEAIQIAREMSRIANAILVIERQLSA